MREMYPEIEPYRIRRIAVDARHTLRLPCTLNNGKPGHIVQLRVEKSVQVVSRRC